jgi:CDP-6-deoxy-D-xylo-4-hexulose-3-dehydrase
MQAACGVAQLGKLEKFIEKRKTNFKLLTNRLDSCREFMQLPVATANSDPSWFGFPITVKENCSVSRLELIKSLDQYKINTRLLFAGNLTKQPSMENANFLISESLENTDVIMNNTFWIGVWPGLTEEMLHYVCDKIELIIGVKS